MAEGIGQRSKKIFLLVFRLIFDSIGKYIIFHLNIPDVMSGLGLRKSPKIGKRKSSRHGGIFLDD
ncbi:MAG: hypothetical protein V2A64_04115 [Candidatus Omnitrophota bacterium]